ncbi:reverse transcriptase domain-containing protein [Tanacetum coccineum]
MIEFATRVRQDTDKIYTRLDDEQTERQLMAGLLNMLYKDKRAHAHTCLLMERGARMSAGNDYRVAGSGPQETSGDYRVAGSRPQETSIAMIDQGVTAALAARDANRSTNGDDSHMENQVKFATFTPHSVTLTWWNTHVKTVGHDSAYGMPWKTLMKMMTDKYCPRNEIKKLEMEIWDLKVKVTDLTSYTQRFQELALLCGRMFPEESNKIEKYVGGLPDMIHGSVVASKPKIMQDAVELATELMDKKILTFVERQTKSKRKLEDTSRNTQNQ